MICLLFHRKKKKLPQIFVPISKKLTMGSETENAKTDQPEPAIGDDQQMRKEHFVLVHGLGHGGWCWYKIKTLMENSGYKVSCVDLKSAGLDQTDPNTISAFDDYNKPLLDFLDALPHDEQIILVGHSAGGLSVTDASYKYPNKIKLAVYIAATMLKNGFATEQDVKDGMPDLSDFEDPFDLGFSSGSNQPPTSVMIKKHLLRKVNYQMSPLEDSTLASLLVRPGPYRALSTPIFNLSGRNEAEIVPRIYIKTTQDNALKLANQEAMVKKWPPSSVYALESDHSPFFSAPFLLFGLLVKATASL